MTPIEKVFTEYGLEIPELRDIDKWQVSTCPFHEETNPSFSINPVLGAYKCFSCGVKGNLIKLIMDREEVSYSAAVGRATEITGHEVAEVPRRTKKYRKPPRSRLFD